MGRLRWGVAISGGGRNGAFAAGVIARIHDEWPSFRFDTVAGTSTGAIMATPVLLGHVSKLTRAFRGGLTESRILRRRYLHGVLVGEFSCSAPLRSIIDDSVDVDGIAEEWEQGRKAVVSCVNTRTGKLVRRWSEPEVLSTWVEYVLASASYPVLMPPVAIDGDDHVDGGLIELTPIRPLIEDEVDGIVALRNYSPYPREMSESPRGLGPRITRAFDVAMSAEGRVESFDAECALAGIKLIDVWPHFDLGPSMDFDPRAMKRVWAIGYDAGESVVARLKLWS